MNTLNTAPQSSTPSITPDRVPSERIDTLMASLRVSCMRFPGSTTTVAIACLPGGFTVAEGKSACVDPALFNAGLGIKYATQDALEKARGKLWELEGYTLFRQREAVRNQPPEPFADKPPHQRRVYEELRDLSDKADKLATFIATKHHPDSIFSKLREDEQMRLYQQLDVMRRYQSVLNDRIAAF